MAHRTRTVSATLVTLGCVSMLSACGLSTSSPATTACKQYAEAFQGTDRDAIMKGLRTAYATAKDSTDEEALNIARAIDGLMTQTVMGTNESVLSANDIVIRECDAAGVTITME